MDIAIAIERLGLNANTYRLTQSVPPHELVSWEGPDPQPTQEELQAAWDAFEAEGGVAKVEAKFNRAQAYEAEADELYMQYERGEVEKAVWTAKVAEIKQRYPYPA